MNVLVAGYDQEETRRLSGALRTAGHKVLGAVGRHGARTFVRVITPDCVMVPTGAPGEEVRGWLEDVGVALAWVTLAPGGDPVAALAGVEGGARRGRERAAAVTTADGYEDALDDAVTVAVAEASRPDAGGVPRTRPITDRRRDTGPAMTFAGADVQVGDVGIGEDAPTGPRMRPDHVGPTAPRTRRRADTIPPGGGEGRRGSEHPDLVSKLAQIRFGDYHSILEVDLDASPYVIREQFQRLSRLYSPQGWPEKLSPEELSILTEVGRGMRDAYLLLGDPELRARYERAVVSTAGARR